MFITMLRFKIIFIIIRLLHDSAYACIYDYDYAYKKCLFLWTFMNDFDNVWDNAYDDGNNYVQGLK